MEIKVTEIEHSVILNDSTINGIQQRIIDSLIGQRVSMQVSPKSRLRVLKHYDLWLVMILN
jgi:hypothetical protein